MSSSPEYNIVQTLWIDSVFGEHQKRCMKSFLDKGCTVHLFAYTDVKNLPEGIQVKDANVILDRSLIFKDLHSSYATFSDWFRIKLLYDVGGWWIDSDMLCVKPFNIDWPYVFASETARSHPDDLRNISNCVIKMPKGSEMGKSILERIEATLSKVDFKEIKWTEIGAKYLAAEIASRNLYDYIVKTEVFCPFHYLNFRQIFDGTPIVLEDITHGIHLWNKMWEWSAEQPIEEMHSDSIFNKIVDP